MSRPSRYRSPSSETEKQRLERLDREAIRSYSSLRYSGTALSKRYYRDLGDLSPQQQVDPNQKK